MRRSLLAAALLAATALTPVRADAAPVLGFLAGAASALTGGAILSGLTGMAGFAAGAGIFGTALGALAGRVVLSLGLSALANALAPHAASISPGDSMQNWAAPIAPMERAVGRCRKGGPLGFRGRSNAPCVSVTDTRAKQFNTIIFASHSIKGVLEYWLGETQVTLAPDGYVSTGAFDGYYHLSGFTGASGQVADPDMVACFDGVTASFDFKGLAGVHTWVSRPPEKEWQAVMPGGPPATITAVGDWDDQIYDPRTDTTGWTRNAALIIARWITRDLGREVDWDEVAEEADICDLLVTDRNGDEAPRWRLDGFWSLAEENAAVRAALGAACDAFFYERVDGKYGFKVGHWDEPTVTLTAADFLSVQIAQGDWGADAPTAVAVTYTEPDNQWREAPSGAYVIEGGSREVIDRPAVYMIASHNQAARVNKRMARAKRARGTLQGTLNLRGYDLLIPREGQAFTPRFVRVEIPGLVSDTFEVGQLVVNEGGITFDVTLTVARKEDWDFDAATEEPPRPPLSPVQETGGVVIPVGLAGASGAGEINWSWPAPSDTSIAQEFRIARTADLSWVTYSISSGSVTLNTPATEGVEYRGELRNIAPNGGGVSPWAPAGGIDVTFRTTSTPPIALTAFTAVPVLSDVALSATSSGSDAAFDAVRWWRGATATFADAEQIGTTYGAAGATVQRTDGNLEAGAHYYWAQPINDAGISGPESGPVTATI